MQGNVLSVEVSEGDEVSVIRASARTLVADPLYDPNRCSIGFHPLHTAPAVALYVLCVQVPTVAVNVPLNNRLQGVDVEALGPTGLRAERESFEARWVFWNRFRTAFGVITVGLLLGVLV